MLHAFGGFGNVIVCAACLTVNERVTGAAGWKSASPAWLAVRVQVPAVRRLIDRPVGLQTAGVVEVRVTGNPELAVAVTVIGDWARVEFGGWGKLIVCGTGAAGVTAFDGAEGGLVPTLLVAVTVNV